MTELAHEFTQQMTENYPVVKIEDQVANFNIELYNPLNDEVENMTIDSYRGKWLVLFFYPADFTFVCPTELKDLQKRYTDFAAMDDVAILAGSTDTVFAHRSWISQEGLMKWFQFPMFADRTGVLSKYFWVLNHNSGHAERATFIISPDGILKTMEIHTEPLGRSAGELLRKLKWLRYITANPGEACVASRDTGGPSLKPSLKITGNVEANIN